MKIYFNDKKLRRNIQMMTARLDAMGKTSSSDAKKIIEAVCDKMVEETVKRAPFREGFLQSSIERHVANSTIASKVEGRVFIAANSPASEYALYMHEGHYVLGSGSTNKQMGQSEVVGRKYMQRAFDENERAFALYIIKGLQKALKKGSKK